MAKTKHDLIALSAQITALSARDAGAPDDPPEMRWNAFYPYEIDKAITTRAYGPLIRLLEAKLPIHPLLLPALASALKALIGKAPGRKDTFSQHQKKWAVDNINRLVRGTKEVPGVCEEELPMSQNQAIAEHILKEKAAGRTISESTVKLALRITRKK